MPIAFVPDATTDICLQADEQRPPQQRVYFRCRFLTRREAFKVRDLLRQAVASDKGEDQDRLLRDALAVGIIGPVNARHPRTGEALPVTLDSVFDVLSASETMDLAVEYTVAISLSESEKKASGSAPATPSASKECAEPAGSPATA